MYEYIKPKEGILGMTYNFTASPIVVRQEGGGN